MNIEEIRELAKIVKENKLESIELDTGSMHLKIKMPSAGQGTTAVPAVSTLPVAEVELCAAQEETAGFSVKSPMVGVFYSMPSPDAQPFVTVGDMVKKGDVLCIIEAMKLMNEIISEKDGQITEICVENGQVVEFGQPLFKVL